MCAMKQIKNESLLVQMHLLYNFLENVTKETFDRAKLCAQLVLSLASTKLVDSIDKMFLPADLLSYVIDFDW